MMAHVTRKINLPLIGILAVAAVTLRFEAERFISVPDRQARPLAWLTDAPLVWLSLWDRETTGPFLCLLILPFIILVYRTHVASSRISVLRDPRGPWKKVFGSIAIFTASLLASAVTGLRDIPVRSISGPDNVRFAELPPAYHDEYSYLLQARTFADGRLSWPPMMVRPDLFHQMHVLNEYRTASRYFPWNGLWISIFLPTGLPILGHWVAGALAAAFFYLSAALVMRPSTALVAGLLIAVSPGIAVFSNLLLAHHPTLLALSIFLWAMMHLRQHPSFGYSATAGVALSLAMLGRPMTAAGFALPWGIYFVWKILRPSKDPWRARRLRYVAGLAIPVICGFGFLAVLNHNITGSSLQTGYQQYTDTYTPRHAYGFGNGTGGDARNGRKVITKYDQWAANLTPELAFRNLRNRCLASAQWSLAVIPVLLGLLLSLLRAFPGNHASSDWASTTRWLILSSVVSLHLVHLPYWYDGIMHWHYVFETAPLILILVADGLEFGTDAIAKITSQRAAALWMFGFLLSALVPGWISVDATWRTSKVSAAVGELSYSRVRFHAFQKLMASTGVQKPALVLVDDSAADPQLSYIINDPELRGDVLVARQPENADELSELTNAFPERHLYSFDPQSFVISPMMAE